MSFNKLGFFSNINEVSGKKSTEYNDSNKYRSNSQFVMYRNRDVFPQLSEPDDYDAICPMPSTSKSTFTMKQSLKKHEEKLPYSRPINRKEAGNHNRPIPSFRQYMKENEVQEIDKDYFTSLSTSRNFNNQPRHRNDAISCDSGFTFGEIQQSNNEAPHIQQRKGLIGTKTRHLTGSVDQAVRWHKMFKNSDMILHFEVLGTVERSIKKDITQLIFMKSDTGHVLQGVFYAIDRELPVFSPGALISATGKMIGSNKLHIFDAVQIQLEDLPAIQRLAFLSQRSLQESL